MIVISDEERRRDNKEVYFENIFTEFSIDDPEGLQNMIRVSCEDFPFRKILVWRNFLKQFWWGKFSNAHAWAQPCRADSRAPGQTHSTTLDKISNNRNVEHLRSKILTLTKYDSTTFDIARPHSASLYEMAKRSRHFTRHKCRTLSNKKVESVWPGLKSTHQKT